MRMVSVPVLAAALLRGPLLPAQSPVAAGTAQHQREIVNEFSALLAIPNVSRNDADMRRNAEVLKSMFEKRGFSVELQPVTSGAPVILAMLDTPGSQGTLTLYIHYDGQAVDSTEW